MVRTDLDVNYIVSWESFIPSMNTNARQSVLWTIQQVRRAVTDLESFHISAFKPSVLTIRTVYVYQTLAASSFDQLSVLAAIQTCVTIMSAVAKPPIAKLSDTLGRGGFQVLVYSL
jgi:hypothetical protein